MNTSLPCLSTPGESCSCPRSRGTSRCHGPVQVKILPAASPKKSKLWLWVVAACLLQITAWTAWFIIAAHHHVQEIPLQTSGGRTR